MPQARASIVCRLLAVGCLSLSLSSVLVACSAARVTGGSAVEGDDTRAPASQASAAPLALNICRTRVSNPPPAISGSVTRRSALACAQGVELLVAPAPGACLSSGFGPRRGRLHKGIDYQSKPAGPVVAAASGTIVRRRFREKDYGHWLVIDHGNGVHTGYAHLAEVAQGIDEGVTVHRGQQLGTMGNTGKSARAVHLHVEYRVGNLSNPKRWWGLKPVDPFTLPERCPAS